MKIDFFPNLNLAGAFIVIPFVSQNLGSLNIGTRPVLLTSLLYAARNSLFVCRSLSTAQNPLRIALKSHSRSTHQEFDASTDSAPSACRAASCKRRLIAPFAVVSRSTNSIIALGALSPKRKPALIIRVYPPGRSL